MTGKRPTPAGRLAQTPVIRRRLGERVKSDPKQAFPVGPGKGRNAQYGGHSPTALQMGLIDLRVGF